MPNDVIWNALSSITAVAAFVLSVLVWRSQRRSSRAQDEVQARLAQIEEDRRRDEISARDAAEESAKSSEVRVHELRLERGGVSGHSDRLCITLHNMGPGTARRVSAALLESEDRAIQAGLGPLVEETGDFGGFSGSSRLAYYEIDWHGPVPLDVLYPGQSVGLDFWYRFRLVGVERVRLEWEDSSGKRIVRHQAIQFVHD